MNLQDKQSISDRIESYFSINLKEILLAVFFTEKNVDNIRISDFSGGEFIYYSDQVFKQFRSELKRGDFIFFPINFTITNEITNGNFALTNELDAYLHHTREKNLDQAVVHLKRLAIYQIQNNFWNKSTTKVHNFDETKLLQLEVNLEVIAGHLENYSKRNIELQHQIESEKEKLINFQKSKEAEFQNLTNQLNAAGQNSTEIQRILDHSRTLQTDLDTLYNSQKSQLDDIKNRLDEEKKVFESFNSDLDTFKKDFKLEITNSNDFNKRFSSLLDKVISDSANFESRLAVLNELIGKEGAVMLFRTFHDRKEELKKPVESWRNIVIGTAIASLAVIIGLFTNFYGLIADVPSTISWQFLVVNSLKSVPIIILLYFTIKQYSKERAFQEEYAFRSAIALTIQAYSDIAGANKEKLILDAVQRIYTTPMMMKEKSGSLFSIRTNSLRDTLKELNETVKNIKP